MIRYLFKTLNDCPQVDSTAGYGIRPFLHANDIDAWLSLREVAFANETPVVGNWTRKDFTREFIEKPWWQPEKTWVAVPELKPNIIIGSCTLIANQDDDFLEGAIHWLMVDPAWRGQGVARALLSQLEHSAWQLGVQTLRVETHTGWGRAVRFYELAGYSFAMRTA